MTMKDESEAGIQDEGNTDRPEPPTDADDAAKSLACPHSTPMTKSAHPPNPLEQASIWSRIFFLWAYPLVRLGKIRPLEDNDLPTLADVDSSDFQANHIQQIWKEEKEKAHDALRPTSLARALFRDYWRRTRRARWILAGNMVSRLVQTIALGRILRLLDKGDTADSTMGYAWAALLVVCGFVSFPTKQLQFFETYRIGYVIVDELFCGP